MRPTIQAVVLLIVLAFSSLNARAQRIDVMMINPNQTPPEATDTTRLLYATYLNGRVDSVVILRWDESDRQWYKEIATDWSTPIRQPDPAREFTWISKAVVGALKLDGLEPQRFFVFRGPTQLTLAPWELLEVRISGRESEHETRSRFNGSEFGVFYRRERIYFPDGKLKESTQFNADETLHSKRVYERTFDSLRSIGTVLIRTLSDGELAVIDSEVYVYRNGLIEQATIGYGLDREDVSHVRMYFSGWQWRDTVIGSGRFTGLDYGGNGFDTIRRQKWVDGSWVSDGVTIHEYKDANGQLSYTFESHREGAQGVVAWGEDSIWYYPNGDLERHDQYKFNISLEEPYWTAEFKNSYLNDGRLASSAYYYSGSLAWTDYLSYSDLASMKRKEDKRLSLTFIDDTKVTIETEGTGPHWVQVFDVLGKVVSDMVVKEKNATLNIGEYPPGMYVVRCGDRAVKFIR